MAKNKRKILLLGFDSLTYGLLMRWLHKLQGFRELMFDLKTAWGPLESTMPPLSPPAWAAIATGMNPGKTGIFGWMTFDKVTRQLKHASLQNIKGLTFWDIAMLLKKMRVALIRFPVITYPQYNRFLFKKTGGVLISGMPIEDLTPETVHPEQLAFKLSRDSTLKIVPIVNIDIPRNEQNVEKIVRRSMLKWHKVSLELFKAEDWDIFSVVFTELDLIQHYFMGHMDPEYPHKEYLSKGYKNTIFFFYKLVDRILRDYLKVADNYDIIIVSDHGSGPVYYDINMNYILAKLGLLNYYQEKTLGFISIRKSIRDIATKFLEREVILQDIIRNMPEFVNKYAISKFRNIWLKSTTEYVLSVANIKMTSVIAFGDFSNIYVLNTRNISTVRMVLKRIINRLINRLPEHLQRKAILDIFEASSIFKTLHLKNTMPDLVAYGEVLKPTSKLPMQPLIATPVKTGDHTRDGFYLIKSDLIGTPSNSKNIRQQIYSIAPTILAILGLPIPNIVDGEPLVKCGLSKVIDHKRLKIRLQLASRRQNIYDRIVAT